MKDQYGRTIIEEKEFDFSVPERGINKKAIRIITILLFLTAAIVFMYPDNNGDSPTDNLDVNNGIVRSESERIQSDDGTLEQTAPDSALRAEPGAQDQTEPDVHNQANPAAQMQTTAGAWEQTASGAQKQTAQDSRVQTTSDMRVQTTTDPLVQAAQNTQVQTTPGARAQSDENATESTSPGGQNRQGSDTGSDTASQDGMSKSCVIAIECKSILNNKKKLTPGKDEVLPSNGIILEPVETVLLEGESAFDVLRRVTREKKIHMEFTRTPIYKSYYIEGINNIYEFDCGELSGWMYNVNGNFPGYSCGGYKMQDKDVLTLIYSCDLGRNVGGNLADQKDQ